MSDINKEIKVIKNGNARDLGIYIHIPFCVKKCDYCDFLSAPGTEEAKADYIDALLTEIYSYQGSTEELIVPTIFFGGGTPSCIDADYISKIMVAISKVFKVDNECLEATIEINPGTVTRDKLMSYKKAGINRLSFGLQSTNDNELKSLGRIHRYEDFTRNYDLAREIGFTNINVDLMSALPGQTLKSWEDTLNTVVAMKPEHISAYSLIIEEGTKFYERYQPDSPYRKELPDEDTDREIYHRTKELLEAYGYHRYEISNYAKEGYECRHNDSYWIGTEYLGIGLGASSLLDGVRFSNRNDIKQYNLLCKEYKNKLELHLGSYNASYTNNSMSQDVIGLRKEIEQLTKQQRIEEFMFLGLRRCEGISKKTFFSRFEENINHTYGEVLAQLAQKRLVDILEDNIRLTEFGIDISNSVLSEFLLN